MANSADTDQMLQKATSDQSLHCLHEKQEFLQNVVIQKLTRHPAIGNRPIHSESCGRSPLDVNNSNMKQHARTNDFT